VYFTHITSNEHVCHKLYEQKSGILPDVVSQSILKQTVGAKTFIILNISTEQVWYKLEEQERDIIPDLVK